MLQTQSSAGTPTPHRAGCAGRVFFSIFFAGFVAMGLLFTVLLVNQIRSLVRTHFWMPRPCTIIESKVVEHDRNDKPYVFTVRYSYASGEVEAKQGTVYRLRYSGSDDYAEAARLVARYGAGTTATCYVSAGANETVLAHDSLWQALFLLVPLVFVAIGGGGLYFLWSRTPANRVRPKPLSQKPTITASGIASFFFPLFLLIGLALFLGVFAPALTGMIKSLNWKAVPCVIQASSVRVHPGDESTTYSVRVLYAYEYDGLKHKSSRYHFGIGSSSGRSGKEQIVRNFPPGSRATCFVNPDDPYQAVLYRGPTAELWFAAIPIAFMLFGGGGTLFALKARGTARSRGAVRPGARLDDGGAEDNPSWLPPVAARQSYRGQENGPIVLKQSSSPLAKFLAMLFFAVFWNGLVSVFLVMLIPGWFRGKPDVCPSLFMIPFVLVGLILLVAVAQTGLACFNPRVQLFLSQARVALGQSVTVAWQVDGRSERIARLSLRLEGREEATYQRDSDSTTTDKSTFAIVNLCEATEPEQIRGGKVSIDVPANSMHSFKSRSSRIRWMIIAHGQIPRWPDINDEYEIVVTPAMQMEAPA